MNFILFLQSFLLYILTLGCALSASVVAVHETWEDANNFNSDFVNSVTFGTSAWRMPSSEDQMKFLEWYNLNQSLDGLDFNDYDVDGDFQTACFPFQIHLALADQYDQRRETLNSHTLPNNGITVSFSISSLINQSCDPMNIQISILYGTRLEDDKSYNDADRITSQTKVVVVDAASALQYHAKSILTNETYTSDWIYHVSLTNLIPQTKYWYSIQVSKRNSAANTASINLQGDTSPGTVATTARRSLRYAQSFHSNDDLGLAISKVITQKIWFQSPPNPLTRTKISIVGDLGQTYNSTITMLNILRSTQLIQNNGTAVSKLASSDVTTSLVLCAGDMSYANSIQSQWDTWFTLLQPLAQSVPFHVAAGNHEVECDASTKLPFQAYENRFRMPNRIADAIVSPVKEEDYQKWGPHATCATPSVYTGQYDYGNSFYSFDYGYMKVIVLSSYSYSDENSNQYKWLLKELKLIERNRERTPWVIVMMHTQFYTTFKGHNDEKQTIIMKHSMEPLFQKYGVNMVFSGHDHAYMRTKPLYKGEIDHTGGSPIYIIVGEGGNREGHVKQFLNPDPEIWVAVRDLTVFSFGTLDVVNITHAKWQFNMDGKTNGFIDDVWIENYVTV